MAEDISSVFNRLSYRDRMQLKLTAGLKTLNDFIREDGEKYPWKNPLYAAFMVCLVVPIPIVPQGPLMLGSAVLFARFSKTEMACELRRRLDEAFTEAAITKEYGDYIKPVPGKPDACHLRNFDLVTKSTVEMLDTTWRVCIGTGRTFRDWIPWVGRKNGPA